MSNPAPEDSTPSTPPVPKNGVQGDDNAPLQPQTPPTNHTPSGTSPRDSFTPSAAPLVTETGGNDVKALEANVDDQQGRCKPLFKRPIFWFAVVAAVVIVVLAVVLPVYFTVIKPKNNTSSNGNGNTNGSNNPQPTNSPNSPKGLTTGGDGSTVTMDNGTQFTYHNPFGGFCTSVPLHRLKDWGSYASDRRGLGSRTAVQRQCSATVMDSSFKHDVEMGGEPTVRVSTVGLFISVAPSQVFSEISRKIYRPS